MAKWWLTIPEIAVIERFLEAAKMHGLVPDETDKKLRDFIESCRLTPRDNGEAKP